MNNYFDDQLNDAINTFEILINSEHKDLFLDILNNFIRHRKIDGGSLGQASNAMKTVFD